MRKMTFIFLVVFIPLVNAAQPPARQPNIVLIMADDLGYGDLGCYGQQKIATPNIDQLAAQGLRFTQFYSGTTVCAPSRASLMTGLHTGHTVVRGNKSTEPEGQTPLPASTSTFVNRLQNAGYATAAFGKWGLGYITTTGAPAKKGFDRFYGYNCQALAHDYYPDHLWNNDERVDLSVNLKGDSIYSADLIHQQAIKYLQARDDKPFFIFLPYTLPHGDVIVPHDSIYNFYQIKFAEPPLTERPARYSNRKGPFDLYPHAAFAAMVSRLDKYVGDVIAVLKEKKMLENTLIIFASDNGPHRENGGDPDFFNSNGPLKGIKRDMYEGGIRVPFIAYWQGTIKPGVSRQQGAFWDIYPTFMQLAGIKNGGPVDGVSILPTLTGKGKQSQHEYYYWEFHEQNGRQAVRWKDWKGIRLNVSKDDNAPIELYDLAADIGEEHNIAEQHPDIIKKIKTFMQEAHVQDKNWPLLTTEK